MVDLEVEDFLLASIHSAVRGARMPGRRPWTVGITRLAGVPVVLVLVGDRGRAGGVVTVRRLLVTVVRRSSSTVLQTLGERY